MWLKLIGSIMVISSGTGIGFSLATRFVERPRQIRQIISCLAALKSHINYVAVPLPEALSKCTGGVTGPVADLFHKMAGVLSTSGWLTPQEAMRMALTEARCRLVLSKPEREMLEVFSANLGSMNREEQEKSLEMVHEQLSRIQYDAEKLCEQNVKMYRYLGVCGSLAVVILLL